MINQSVLEKPNFVIFLDIDGVLNPTKWINLSYCEWDIKIENIEKEWYSHIKSATVRTRKAQTHFFDKGALKLLKDLILRIEVLANVHIVISSDWRIGLTVDQLRVVFDDFIFSNYITDKTTYKDYTLNWKKFCVKPDDDHEKSNCPEKLAQICRGSEINQYLEHHPEYQGFVIFDDLNGSRHHLSDNFGDKFIWTRNILEWEQTEKAYAVFLNFIKDKG